MFEWDDRSQKEKRLKKSQLYKEMLDNQILMNKHYKQSQLAKVKAFDLDKRNQNRSKNSAILNKKLNIIKKMKQRNLEENGIILPSIAVQPRYYRGHSRYRPVDQVQTKNYATNILQTEIDQQSSSESDEVEQIIKQMKLITKKINQNNRKKTRKLVTDRLARQYANFKRQETVSTINQHEDSNPENSYRRFKSKSVGLRTNRKENNLNQKLQKFKTDKNYDNLSPQSDRKNSFLNQPNQQQAFQKNKQIQKQRQKFMNILKKVNKRGKNLLMRVSNFPSPKTQFIDLNDD